MLEVHLPDGTVKEYQTAVSIGQVAAEIGPGLARAAVAGQVDGKTVGIDFLLPPEGSVQLRILTKKDPEALDVMRHSCRHVMARAVMRLFDGVQLAFGPTIDGGFYYDFDLEHSLTEEDFPAIEAEMKKIIELDEPFERIEQSRDEVAASLPRPGAALQGRTYRGRAWPSTTRSRSISRENFSICVAGRTSRRPKSIGAFKLLSVAGAYWKGDSSRKQLQRLYGPPSSTRRTWKSTWSGSKRPNGATIACWASNSNCSPSTRSSAPAW